MFELTNEQVERDARRAATWLGRHHAAGDRIAVCLENVPAYVPLAMAALRSGIVPVPVNVHLAAGERDRIISDAQVSAVIDERAALDWSDEDEADLAPFPLARPMHYTSGTTGHAKGVWSGIFSDSDAEALAMDERELWAPGPGDTYLVCSPLYHSAPLRIATSALLAGARVLIFEHFDAPEVARAFVEENVNGAFLVPTHLRRLLEVEGFSAPAARRILHAGEACPEGLKRHAIDVFGADNLHEFYGSTEGQFTFCSSAEWLERPGTVGRARSGRRLFVEDAGDDGVGTIFTTAPTYASWEYWGDPEKTERAWQDVPIGGGRSEASFTVGDLGRLDDDGYLYIEGRRDDLIITGGVNVYPAEVERVLSEHSDVVEVAVFGIVDDEWGQKVCAAVVGDVDEAALRTWARARLAPAQVPKMFFAVDALPRTGTGKIKRRDLAADLRP